MAVLLDTDVAIELLRGNEHALSCVAACQDDIYVSSITAAELYFGAYHSKRVEQNVNKVAAFLEQFRLLSVSHEVARIFGETKARMCAKSTPVDSFDLLIASIALAYDCAVATGNVKHFSRVDRLRILDWIHGH